MCTSTFHLIYVSTQLTQCDVAALHGSVAGGAAPGVRLEVSDQTIPPLPDITKLSFTWCPACPCSPRTPGARPHTARSAWAAASPGEGHYNIATVVTMFRMTVVTRTSKQMGHSNSDFQKAASISYCACSLSPLFSFSSIFFSSSLSLLRE